MEAFLKEAKNGSKITSSFNKIHVVLGSEACDLDSAVSTLVLAYLLSKVNKDLKVVVVPVLNVSRRDFRLKTEVTFFLEENGIDADDIVFENEVDLTGLHTNGKLQLTLVDHNSMVKPYTCLQPAVVEIIDHHKRSLDRYGDNCRITIELVGSCATLVAEKIFSTDSSLMDSHIAKLLLGTILFDTVCLDELAGRVTDKDKQIVKQLEALNLQVNRRHLFNAILQAKCDISGLCVNDVLRKDLKLVSNSVINIAVSSIPVLVQDFLDKIASVKDLKKFNSENNYQVLVIMGILVDSVTNKVTRDIGVYSINDVCKQQVADFLYESQELKLDPVDPDSDVLCLSVFHQGNVKCSRKTVLPIVNIFLNGSEDTSNMPFKERYAGPEESRTSDSYHNLSSSGATALTPTNGDSPSVMGYQNTSDSHRPQDSRNPSSHIPSVHTPMNCNHDDFDTDSYTTRQEDVEENYPFTPKNSFVDSSFEGYMRQLPTFDSDTLLQKVHAKQANFLNLLDENNKSDLSADDDLKPRSVRNKSPVEEESNSDIDQKNLGQKSSPDDNSLCSSRSDKGEVMDISTSGSDLISPATMPITSTELKLVTGTDNAITNSKECYTATTNSNSGQDIETELATNYQAETVDFPDSPNHMKLLARRTNDERKGMQDDMGQDDDEIFRTVLSPGADDVILKKDRPNTLSKDNKKKIKVTADILGGLENGDDEDDNKSLSSMSNKSGDILSPFDDNIATPDDIDTPDELDDCAFERLGSTSEPIPELSAAEEYDEERSWRTCVIMGVQRKIDMKVIDPYKKVLSHGGYCEDTRYAIIVFSACHLPDRSRRDYDYVMDNLFLYVLTTLDELVADNYILLYLHGATERSNMPGFGWLKRCYQMIDRRLRKNLKGLYLVHPTFWLKTIVLMTKPFISTKFSRKLRFVATLEELASLIPMDHVCIPDKVKQLDFEFMIKRRKKVLKIR